MAKFVKKLITVDAIQFNGDNPFDIISLVKPADSGYDQGPNQMVIFTEDRCIRLNAGEWIVRDMGGFLRKYSDKEFNNLYSPGEGDATI